MENGKPWWQSKTIWFNVITGVVEIAQSLSGTGLVPPGILTVIVNMGNVLLRLITKSPIGQ